MCRLALALTAVSCLWTQADEGEEACPNIGSLFDESVTEAADSAHFQDFGAADEAHLTGVRHPDSFHVQCMDAMFCRNLICLLAPKRLSQSSK